MEVYVDDEAKLTLHGLQQHYVKLKDSEKNRKLFELLDVLEFNQASSLKSLNPILKKSNLAFLSKKVIRFIQLLDEFNLLSVLNPIYCQNKLVGSSTRQGFYTVRVTDFGCNEFVDDCGTTKPLAEQHVSMTVGKLKAH
jgi:hypothetical protein